MSMPIQGMPGRGGTAPGPPAPAGPPGKPTNDERLFAALAYLSYLVGFWFIGPLAVYGMKGRTSRFVRFHAGQALVTTLAVVIGMTVAAVIFIAGGFALALLHALTDVDELGIVLEIIRMLASAFFGVVPTLLIVIAGARAYGGSDKPVPMVGRYAKLIQEPLFKVVDSIASSSSTSPGPGGHPPAAGGHPPAGGGYPPAAGGHPPAAGGSPPWGGPPPGGTPPAPGGPPPPPGGPHPPG